MSPVSLVFHTIVTWDWSLFAAMVVDGGHNEQWYKNCTKNFKKKNPSLINNYNRDYLLFKYWVLNWNKSCALTPVSWFSWQFTGPDIFDRGYRLWWMVGRLERDRYLNVETLTQNVMNRDDSARMLECFVGQKRDMVDCY